MSGTSHPKLRIRPKDTIRHWLSCAIIRTNGKVTTITGTFNFNTVETPIVTYTMTDNGEYNRQLHDPEHGDPPPQENVYWGDLPNEVFMIFKKNWDDDQIRRQFPPRIPVTISNK